MQTMKLVKVQGRGSVSCPPDLATLSFEIEVKSPDYAACLQDLNARTEDLRQAVASATEGRAELKTTAFNVSVDTQYRNGRSLQIGYTASHSLQIEMPVDTALLNRAFRAIAAGQNSAQIRIAFSVKDKDSLRRRVLADAVRAGRSNAVTLAEAAGVKLGPLQRIEYGWAEIRFSERDTALCCESAPANASYDPDIRPDDVQAEDNVTLEYALEQ